MRKLKKLVLFLALLMFATIILSSNVFASEDVFDKLLTDLTDGKFVVHSVKPTNQEMAYIVVYEYTMKEKYPENPGYYIKWDTSFNEDFSKCTVYYGNYQENDPSKEVEISYIYDNDVKTVVDSLISKLNGKDTFNLNEIEFINYLINESEDASMANYSSELRKAIDYKNFSIDVRYGDDSSFYTERGGNAVFSYNDTVYYIKPMTTAQAKHIIYVEDNTTDVLESIKTRLTKVFGTDFNVKEKDTVASFLTEARQDFISRYSQETYLQQQYDSADAYADAMMNEAYYNDDAWYHFVVGANVYEKYYTLTINDEEVNFLVVKDSSKVNNNINLITNDVGSDITISAETASIPLDTLIQVSKITSGAEYEKIVKLLEVTNSEMFDLKLYSSSIGKYITKLSDGTFEVKIPVNETLKGKDLMVYYVDANNEVEEYKVTVKDGYATFTTDHFSIYTLAEKKVVEEAPDNTEKETPDNTLTNTEKETPTGEKDETPKTGTLDIISYVLVATFISAVGIIVLKKKI